MMCDLCKIDNGYIEAQFWHIVICRTCDIPMAVLKRHSHTMTLEEAKELVWVWERYFFGKELRTQARQILDHIHYHFL